MNKLLASLRLPRDPKDRAFLVAVLVLLAIGILLRSNGFWVHPIGLWGDEATWAMKLERRSLLSLRIRPIGFMWVTSVLTSNIAMDERTLRLLPYAASVLTLLLAPYVGRCIFKTRLAAVVTTAMFALHPTLVDFAKEFKPYSVEVCAHLALVALYLAYRRTRSGWLYYSILGIAPVLFLFSYNIIFLFPGLFLLVAIDSWGERRWGRLLVVSGAATVCVVVGLSVYFLAMSNHDTSRSEAFWGRKYNAFYIDSTSEKRAVSSRVDWVVHRYESVAAMPGLKLWEFPKSLDSEERNSIQDLNHYAWVAVHLFSVFWLVSRRRYRHLALLLSPLGVCLLFNQLGLWPFTSFRVNLFLLAYLIPLVGVVADAAFSHPNRWAAWTGRLAIPALLLIFRLGFGFDWGAEKRHWAAETSAAKVLRIIVAARQKAQSEDPGLPPEVVLADAYSCGPMQFYMGYHTATQKKYGDFIRNNLKLRCRTNPRGLKRPFWMFLADPRNMTRRIKRVARSGKILRDMTPGPSQRLIHARPKGERRKAK